MTIREAGEGIVIRSSKPFSYIVGFANRDETELDATSMKDLEELWKSLCPEFGCKEDDVDFIERIGSYE